MIIKIIDNANKTFIYMSTSYLLKLNKCQQMSILREVVLIF